MELSAEDPVWGWLVPMQKHELGLQRQPLLNRCLADQHFLALMAGAVHNAMEVRGGRLEEVKRMGNGHKVSCFGGTISCD